MRKIRVFVLEFFVLPLFIWWFFSVIPDEAVYALLPWVLAAVAWHLLFECIWESRRVKGWRAKYFPSEARQWTFLVLAGVAVYSLLWFVAKDTIDRFTAQHPHGAQAPASISSTTPAAGQE